MDLVLKDKLEQLLEVEYLSNSRKPIQAYICSPLRAESYKELLINMRAAKAYMYYCTIKMNISARAPHAFLPIILCDEIKSERELALQFGLKLLEISDEILICGNRISEGMRGEIVHAVSLGKSIRVFEKSILCEVKNLVREVKQALGCGGINEVIFDRKNTFLSLASQDVFSCDWDWALTGGVL